MTARPATLLLLASHAKPRPRGGAVGTRIAHEAVAVALVELHDALIALETI